MEVSKEKRNELYLKQPAPFEHLPDTKFVTDDFICWKCHKDLLSNKNTLEDAIKGIMITGCPFCNRSYCD